jgi:hypothetical protein
MVIADHGSIRTPVQSSDYCALYFLVTGVLGVLL